MTARDSRRPVTGADAPQGALRSVPAGGLPARRRERRPRYRGAAARNAARALEPRPERPHALAAVSGSSAPSPFQSGSRGGVAAEGCERLPAAPGSSSVPSPRLPHATMATTRTTIAMTTKVTQPTHPDTPPRNPRLNTPSGRGSSGETSRPPRIVCRIRRTAEGSSALGGRGRTDPRCLPLAGCRRRTMLGRLTHSLMQWRKSPGATRRRHCDDP